MHDPRYNTEPPFITGAIMFYYERKGPAPSVREQGAADSPHQPIPPGVAVFEDNDRDALTRACLWASVQDRIDLESPLEWSEAAPDDCRRVRAPVVVAAEGNAVLAAYLASYGFPSDDIADALRVGSRTISQYLSDFKKGER